VLKGPVYTHGGNYPTKGDEISSCGLNFHGMEGIYLCHREWEIKEEV
jgi:hypothetical protein